MSEVLSATLRTGWTSARVGMLRELWAKGLSCSQIAGELGGVTRNAVIGKVHRLKLPDNGRTVRRGGLAAKDAKRRVLNQARVGLYRAGVSLPRAEPAAPRRVAKPGRLALATGHGQEVAVDRAPAAPPPEPAVPVTCVGVALLDLAPRHCRFPLWGFHDRAGLFCGNPKLDPFSYCSGHAVLAYTPAPARGYRGVGNPPAYMRT